MSKNFAFVPRVAFEGTPYASPIALCVPPKIREAIGAKAVRIDIDWSAAPYSGGTLRPRVGVDVNLIAQQTSIPLDAIRSVYIDNSFSDFPVFVQCIDTGYTVICPPQAIALLPMVTNLHQVIVYIEGLLTDFVPQTTFQFMNVEVDGVIAETRYNDPVVMRVNNGFSTSVPAAAVVASITVGLGAAMLNRAICLACVAYDNVDGTLMNFASANLNGVPLTIVNAVLFGGTLPAAVGAIFYMSPALAIGLGASATLNVVFTRGLGASGGQLWGASHTLSNVQTGPVASTSTGSQDSAIVGSSLPNVPGVADIYCAFTRGVADSEPIWHNVEPTNYNFYVPGAGSNARLYAASKISTTTGYDTVSVRSQGLLGVTII